MTPTSEVVAKLTEAYDKVAEWPEKRMPGVDITTLGEGFSDLLHLRNLIPEAAALISSLVAENEGLSAKFNGIQTCGCAWDSPDDICSCHSPKLVEAERLLAEARAERDELQQTFDTRWEADMRAIKRWQEAHPGNDNVWPDHADLIIWQEERITAPPPLIVVLGIFGKSQADLAKLVGSRSRASEYINGLRALPKSAISKLNVAWGIPAEVLIRASIGGGNG